MTLWTDAQLTKWRSEIPADFPEWRRESYEEYRRMNCPTFAERRAHIRETTTRHLLDTLRKAPTMPPEWLKPAGHAQMREMIRAKRREHTDLIRQEREALRS